MKHNTIRKTERLRVLKEKKSGLGSAGLISLVKLLARQAAEKDFSDLVKMQEAANDNE